MHIRITQVFEALCDSRSNSFQSAFKLCSKQSAYACIAQTIKPFALKNSILVIKAISN